MEIKNMSKKTLLIISSLLSPTSVAYALDTSGYYPDCRENINFSRASEKEPELVWRNENNTLWRGDTNNEGLDAFKNGMRPKGVTREYPEAERDHDWRCHKEDSFRSVFVSTTENLKTAINFVDLYHPQKEGWVYEIHAPGGINQQLSIGGAAGTYEAEISFPGGVKGKFIKQACYYIKRQLQRCEDNPDFQEPSWKESPEEVAAAVTSLTRVVPKGHCETTDETVTMPAELCPLPDMATTQYFQEGNILAKEGMYIHYDVSDRGPEKPERWILLMSGDKKSDSSHIAVNIPITASMPDTGNVYVSPDKFSSPAYPWQKRFQRWSLGVAHAGDNNQISGPVSYLHTNYFPVKGDVLLDEMASNAITSEDAEKGVRVTVSAPVDRDSWLFTQIKNPVTGQWGLFGGYQKIKAGASKTLDAKIIRSWHPEGGIFRIGLSESVNTPGDVKPLGNTPYIEVTDKP
ncbi:scabin-related ADP-ribosyltransferase [Pantoea cypripedii]|uniref:Pierisin-like domain-containing protein n=1 Tax=Pantoea cypripedii TaxID=55209 RepID=A0A6B9G9J6_PANCY|nr:hypothetical protein [Pantoea cypripedii]QGY32040.1 hypothetical protein CUN67_23870 [Pantoea cypripedii]